MVVIFGATGMLGSAVYDALKDKYNLVLAVRDKKKIDLLEKKYGGVKNHQVELFDAVNPKFNQIGPVDFAINAVGLVIAPSRENPELAMKINGELPHLLAKEYGSRLIHITTDCVFNGKEGYPYDEKSPKTPTDVYSQSKAAGEPTNCLTLRTSIIGPELETYSGLLEWFLQQEGKTINGFANHFWNGVTTKQFGIICDKIFSSREQFPDSGIYHIFSTVVSKYDMLQAFKQKYQINCVINKDTEQKLNRSLATIYPLCQSLQIPPFKQMLEDM